MLFNLLNFGRGRYERKFLVSEYSSQEMEEIIRLNPLMFSEIFYRRRVNNIYLDSMNMENYQSNVVGNSQRLKIRIRWYGKVFGLVKKPVLELKIKNSELGKKISFPLKEFKLDKNFSLEILQKEIFEKSNLPKWLIEELKLCKLTLLNSYIRKYFRSVNKKYRITLDYDLIFFEIRGKNNLFLNKLNDKQNIILELKYDKEHDSIASEMTQYFPFRLTKSSKYVSGIDLLN